MKNNDLEALKMVGEWSKWLASLDTGIITLVGYLSASDGFSIAERTWPNVARVGICCFLVSLLCASFVLYALPGISQRLPPPNPNSDVLTMGTYNGGGVKLFFFSTSQFIFFGIGALLLTVWSIIQ